MKTPRFPIHGWINLDKPYGMGSTDAIRAIKRILRPEKIGHAGTLDPLADGVLPIALGEATKTVPYMMEAKKTYEFTVNWGESRSTDDAEGEVTATSDVRPTPDAIQAILPRFTGKIQQIPPIYSALKVDGKRAYDLARAGEAVELKAREVTIESLELVACPSPHPLPKERASRLAQIEKPSPWGEGGVRGLGAGDSAAFLVTCSKGTYIRSLARDMAFSLGTVGYVSALKRRAVGAFCLSTAISLDFLEEMVHKATSRSEQSLLGVVLPLSTALDDIPALTVSVAEATRLRQGLAIQHTKAIGAEIAVAMLDEKVVAICQQSADGWKPKRVFNI